MPDHSLPDGVERWVIEDQGVAHGLKAFQTRDGQGLPPDRKRITTIDVSDLPKIEEQVRREERERLLGDESIRRIAEWLFGPEMGEHLEAVRTALKSRLDSRRGEGKCPECGQEPDPQTGIVRHRASCDTLNLDQEDDRG